MHSNQTSMFFTPFGRFLLQKETEKPVLLRLATRHKSKDGTLVDFQLNEESEGTQRLLHLLPLLFILKNQANTVIVIDELERKLHPLITRKFVEMALSHQ